MGWVGEKRGGKRRRERKEGGYVSEPGREGRRVLIREDVGGGGKRSQGREIGGVRRSVGRRMRSSRDRISSIHKCHCKEITCHYMVSKTHFLMTAPYSDMSLNSPCHN